MVGETELSQSYGQVSMALLYENRVRVISLKSFSNAFMRYYHAGARPLSNVYSIINLTDMLAE